MKNPVNAFILRLAKGHLVFCQNGIVELYIKQNKIKFLYSCI